MFKNYGSCLSTWEGKRCITETDALTLKFGIPFCRYIETIYEANWLISIHHLFTDHTVAVIS